MILFDHSHIFLVAGDSSGIGRAMALGGTVICAARDEKRLHPVLEAAATY